MEIHRGNPGYLLFCLGICGLISCPVFAQTSSEPMILSDPSRVGISADRLERIDAFLNQYIDEKKLSGFVSLVARKGQVAHYKAYGLREHDPDLLMEKDSIFRIYSMTKPIVSAALLMLYEEGRLQLDDPVEKFIPEFASKQVYIGGTEDNLELEPAERPVTLLDLLTHTSGLIYGFGNTPVDVMYRNAQIKAEEGTLQDFARALGPLPLHNQPGSQWNYSVSIDVVGAVVEIVSGQSLDVFLQERILKPLAMHDTGYFVAEEKKDRLAAMYGVDEEGKLVVKEHSAASPYLKKPIFTPGGGGLVSTAADYLRFCQMLLNFGELEGVRILGRKTVELMFMNHLPPELTPLSKPGSFFYRYDKGYGFGLGFAILVDVSQSEQLGSEGEAHWWGAGNTNFWIDPGEEMIFILMNQYQPSEFYPLSREYKGMVYQALID